MTEKFLRRDEVSRTTGLPVSTIYQQMGLAKFPRPVRISPRLVAWRESEILEWQEERIAEREGMRPIGEAVRRVVDRIDPTK